mmetsp:Transcript_10115/g.22315  ORF Transcript_10115/g.22315 Transcript_10115/m.22315 type:complete len:211 (+) Transcript_10115:34-666(+)
MAGYAYSPSLIGAGQGGGSIVGAPLMQSSPVVGGYQGGMSLIGNGVGFPTAASAGGSPFNRGFPAAASTTLNRNTSLVPGQQLFPAAASATVNRGYSLSAMPMSSPAGNAFSGSLIGYSQPQQVRPAVPPPAMQPQQFQQPQPANGMTPSPMPQEGAPYWGAPPERPADSVWDTDQPRITTFLQNRGLPAEADPRIVKRRGNKKKVCACV